MADGRTDVDVCAVAGMPLGFGSPALQRCFCQSCPAGEDCLQWLPWLLSGGLEEDLCFYFLFMYFFLNKNSASPSPGPRCALCGDG